MLFKWFFLGEVSQFITRSERLERIEPSDWPRDAMVVKCRLIDNNHYILKDSRWSGSHCDTEEPSAINPRRLNNNHYILKDSRWSGSRCDTEEPSAINPRRLIQ